MARCRVDTLEQQVERALQQYNDRETDIRKNSFLQSMKCGSYHSHRPTAIGSLTRTRLTSMRSFSDISLTSLHHFIDLVVFRYELLWISPIMLLLTPSSLRVPHSPKLDPLLRTSLQEPRGHVSSHLHTYRSRCHQRVLAPVQEERGAVPLPAGYGQDGGGFLGCV